MNLPTPASLSRAAFRDGSLDLSIAVYSLLTGASLSFASHGLLRWFPGWVLALLVFTALRRRVFLPRAGHVRLREWRMVAPLLAVGFALTLGGIVSTIVHGGPVPPGSVWDRRPSELMLGCAVIAFLTAWVSLGLRRMVVYGGCALGLLVAHVKGLPATPALLALGLPPLVVGMGLLRRFLQEPVHGEA